MQNSATGQPRRKTDPNKKRVGNLRWKAPYSQILDLLTDAQLLDDGTVAVDFAVLQVVQHAATLTYQLQEAQARAVVLLVYLQVLGEVDDAVGEETDLGLGRTGIGLYFLQAVLFKKGLFCFGVRIIG